MILFIYLVFIITDDTSLRRLKQDIEDEKIEFYDNNKIERHKNLTKPHISSVSKNRILKTNDCINKSKSRIIKETRQKYSNAKQKFIKNKSFCDDNNKKSLTQNDVISKLDTEVLYTDRNNDLTNKKSDMNSRLYYTIESNKIDEDYDNDIKKFMDKGAIKKSINPSFIDSQMNKLISSNIYLLKEQNELEKLKRIRKMYRLNRVLHSIDIDNDNNNEINAKDFESSCDLKIVNDIINVLEDQTNNETQISQNYDEKKKKGIYIMV